MPNTGTGTLLSDATPGSGLVSTPPVGDIDTSMTSTDRVLYSIILSLSSMSCVANIALLLSVILIKQLHKPINTFMVHHLVLEVLKSIYVFGFSKSVFDSMDMIKCSWLGASYVLIITVTVFNLLAITVNDLYHFTHKLAGVTISSSCCAAFGVFVVWLAGLIVNLGMAFIPSSPVYQGMAGVCTYAYGIHGNYLVHLLWTLIITLTVILNIYYLRQLRHDINIKSHKRIIDFMQGHAIHPIEAGVTGETNLKHSLADDQRPLLAVTPPTIRLPMVREETISDVDASSSHLSLQAEPKRLMSNIISTADAESADLTPIDPAAAGTISPATSHQLAVLHTKNSRLHRITVPVSNQPRPLTAVHSPSALYENAGVETGAAGHRRSLPFPCVSREIMTSSKSVSADVCGMSGGIELDDWILTATCNHREPELTTAKDSSPVVNFRLEQQQSVGNRMSKTAVDGNSQAVSSEGVSADGDDDSSSQAIRRGRRNFYFLSSMLLVFVVFWYPLFILTLADVKFKLPLQIYRLLLLFGWCHSITTPIIFFCYNLSYFINERPRDVADYSDDDSSVSLGSAVSSDSEDDDEFKIPIDTFYLPRSPVRTKITPDPRAGVRRASGAPRPTSLEIPSTPLSCSESDLSYHIVYRFTDNAADVSSSAISRIMEVHNHQQQQQQRPLQANSKMKSSSTCPGIVRLSNLDTIDENRDNYDAGRQELSAPVAMAASRLSTGRLKASGSVPASDYYDFGPSAMSWL